MLCFASSPSQPPLATHLKCIFWRRQDVPAPLKDFDECVRSLMGFINHRGVVGSWLHGNVDAIECKRGRRGQRIDNLTTLTLAACSILVMFAYELSLDRLYIWSVSRWYKRSKHSFLRATSATCKAFILNYYTFSKHLHLLALLCFTLI